MMSGRKILLGTWCARVAILKVEVVPIGAKFFSLEPSVNVHKCPSKNGLRDREYIANIGSPRLHSLYFSCFTR